MSPALFFFFIYSCVRTCFRLPRLVVSNRACASLSGDGDLPPTGYCPALFPVTPTSYWNTVGIGCCSASSPACHIGWVSSRMIFLVKF